MELKTDFTVGYISQFILRHGNDIKTLHEQRIMAAIEIQYK